MSKKKASPPPNEQTLTIVREDGKSDGRMFAEIGLSPVALNAYTSQTFSKGFAGAIGINDAIAVLSEKVSKTNDGDTSELEGMLAAQAFALNTIFMEMARRSSINMGEHLQATDIYMRLALKAQSQCRSTVETLAEIKNPRSVAFVRQANIANGPQQVNNGVSAQYAQARARTENSKPIQSKLLEESTDGEWMDTGTAGKAGGSNQEMATVGAINRPQDR